MGHPLSKRRFGVNAPCNWLVFVSSLVWEATFEGPVSDGFFAVHGSPASTGHTTSLDSTYGDCLKADSTGGLYQGLSHPCTCAAFPPLFWLCSAA